MVVRLIRWIGWFTAALISAGVEERETLLISRNTTNHPTKQTGLQSPCALDGPTPSGSPGSGKYPASLLVFKCLITKTVKACLTSFVCCDKQTDITAKVLATQSTGKNTLTD